MNVDPFYDIIGYALRIFALFEIIFDVFNGWLEFLARLGGETPAE